MVLMGSGLQAYSAFRDYEGLSGSAQKGVKDLKKRWGLAFIPLVNIYVALKAFGVVKDLAIAAIGTNVTLAREARKALISFYAWDFILLGSFAVLAAACIQLAIEY